VASAQWAEKSIHLLSPLLPGTALPLELLAVSWRDAWEVGLLWLISAIGAERVFAFRLGAACQLRAVRLEMYTLSNFRLEKGGH
jgi:Mg2+/citrate symporter